MFRKRFDHGMEGFLFASPDIIVHSKIPCQTARHGVQEYAQGTTCRSRRTTMSIDIPILARVCGTPVAPGHEKKIREVLFAGLKGRADEIRADNMGNVIALEF